MEMISSYNSFSPLFELFHSFNNLDSWWFGIFTALLALCIEIENRHSTPFFLLVCLYSEEVVNLLDKM